MRENKTVGKTKKDVAILIPIHPPYFKYTGAIFKSWHKTALDVQSDLWFVFTNESERDRFVAWENCIVLPPELRNFENHGIITIKKFYGLSKIKDEYEYVIIFDAGCRFLKNIDLKAVCNTYWNNKVLLGNAQFKKEISISIKQGCKRFFVSNSNIAELDDDDLYLWFNQPCIYKCDTVDDFFEKIDYAKNAASFSWSEFDYYIYMYYLLMFCGFKIVDMEIRAVWGTLESASKRILKSENTRGGGLCSIQINTSRFRFGFAQGSF